MSFGNWTARPCGAVSSTCSTPTPNRIVQQIGRQAPVVQQRGQSFVKTPATTAPQNL